MVRQKGVQLRRHDWETARQRYAAGVSMKDVARGLGVSCHWAAKRARLEGWQVADGPRSRLRARLEADLAGLVEGMDEMSGEVGERIKALTAVTRLLKDLETLDTSRDGERLTGGDAPFGAASAGTGHDDAG